MLFRGWPIMVHDTHTRRRRRITADGTDTCLHGVLGLGVSATAGIKLVSKKTKDSQLSVGENCMILWLFVLRQYQHVTDRRTDMPPIPVSCSSIAECDTNRLL